MAMPMDRWGGTGALVDPAHCPQLQSSSHCTQHTTNKEFSMLDILMLALGLGFFVLTVGYAYACERL